MDRAPTKTLFGSDRDLADVLPAADDLGGRGRSRLCRAAAHRGRAAGRDHRGRRKIFTRARPRLVIASAVMGAAYGAMSMCPAACLAARRRCNSAVSAAPIGCPLNTWA